ncbi:glycosyltransferase [Escherichia coli]|nr:glycosyltransferase [Escherichia coli]
MDNKKHTVAVIMSVYDGDEPYYFEKAIQSIQKQTYQSIDIYLYIDAVQRKDLLNRIRHYKKCSRFHVVTGDKKRGLAYGLNRLLDKIRGKGYGYIARMDSDDISTTDRIESQVRFLEKNKNIDVIGTNCIEIDGDDNEIFYKKMPETHHELIKSIVKRSPFIHPSVMFRGSVVEHIRYNDSLMNTQDYYLWIDLLSKKYKFYNIQQPLLFFRVNDSFYARRGFGKLINEVKSRLYAMKKLNKKNVKNYLYILALICLRLAPGNIKKYCYMRFR